MLQPDHWHGPLTSLCSLRTTSCTIGDRETHVQAKLRGLVLLGNPI